MHLLLLPALNDGWIGEYGTPKLMDGHPSVRMVAEKIVARVHAEHAEVECRFWFKNEGPATTVRMGFPDSDSDPPIEGEPVKSIYDRFESFVDGKRVATELLPKRGMAEYSGIFQTKTVRFGSHQERLVTNRYRVRLGTLAIDGPPPSPPQPAIRVFNYIFSTGASWKGKIGRTELLVTFMKDADLPPGPVRLVDYPGDQPYAYWRQRRDVVATSTKGFRAAGRRLYLLRENWSPKGEAHDVWISFGAYLRK